MIFKNALPSAMPKLNLKISQQLQDPHLTTYTIDIIADERRKSNPSQLNQHQLKIRMKYHIASKWEKHGGRRGISRYEERYCERIRTVVHLARGCADGLLFIFPDTKSYWIRTCVAPLPFVVLQCVVFAV